VRSEPTCAACGKRAAAEANELRAESAHTRRQSARLGCKTNNVARPLSLLLRKKPDVSWLWSCWRRHGRRWGSNKTRDGGMEATCPFTLLRWLLRLKAGGQAGLPACSDWPAEREGEEGDNNRAGGKAHAPALGQLNYTWRPSHTRPPWLA